MDEDAYGRVGDVVAQYVPDEAADVLAVEIVVEELARRRVEPGQMQREPLHRAAPDLHGGEVPDGAERGQEQPVGGGGPAVDLKALYQLGSCHASHRTRWRGPRGDALLETGARSATGAT